MHPEGDVTSSRNHKGIGVVRSRVEVCFQYLSIDNYFYRNLNKYPQENLFSIRKAVQSVDLKTLSILPAPHFVFPHYNTATEYMSFQQDARSAVITGMVELIMFISKTFKFSILNFD